MIIADNCSGHLETTCKSTKSDPKCTVGYKMKFPTSVRAGRQRPGEVDCAAKHLGRSARDGPPLTYLEWNLLTGPLQWSSQAITVPHTSALGRGTLGWDGVGDGLPPRVSELRVVRLSRQGRWVVPDSSRKRWRVFDPSNENNI